MVVSNICYLWWAIIGEMREQVEFSFYILHRNSDGHACWDPLILKIAKADNRGHFVNYFIHENIVTNCCTRLPITCPMSVQNFNHVG
jgi:hypothetical protein